MKTIILSITVLSTLTCFAASYDGEITETSNSCENTTHRLRWVLQQAAARADVAAACQVNQSKAKSCALQGQNLEVDSSFSGGALTGSDSVQKVSARQAVELAKGVSICKAYLDAIPSCPQVIRQVIEAHKDCLSVSAKSMASLSESARLTENSADNDGNTQMAASPSQTNNIYSMCRGAGYSHAYCSGLVQNL